MSTRVIRRPGQSAWEVVARNFHERVKANCWDTLAGRLAILHEPAVILGQPVCLGCDREDSPTGDPVWPCRTYTLIAATVLNVAESKIEPILETLHQPGRSPGSHLDSRPPSHEDGYERPFLPGHSYRGGGRGFTRGGLAHRQ